MGLRCFQRWRNLYTRVFIEDLGKVGSIAYFKYSCMLDAIVDLNGDVVVLRHDNHPLSLMTLLTVRLSISSSLAIAKLVAPF